MQIAGTLLPAGLIAICAAIRKIEITVKVKIGR
jgi:hypothetical protein